MFDFLKREPVRVEVPEPPPPPIDPEDLKDPRRLVREDTPCRTCKQFSFVVLWHRGFWINGKCLLPKNKDLLEHMNYTNQPDRGYITVLLACSDHEPITTS